MIAAWRKTIQAFAHRIGDGTPLGYEIGRTSVVVREFERLAEENKRLRSMLEGCVLSANKTPDAKMEPFFWLTILAAEVELGMAEDGVQAALAPRPCRPGGGRGWGVMWRPLAVMLMGLFMGSIGFGHLIGEKIVHPTAFGVAMVAFGAAAWGLGLAWLAERRRGGAS
jgi:hypothetical protein